MNATNRGANRALLITTGVLVAAAGVLCLLLVAVPSASAGWRTLAAGLPVWATRPTLGGASTGVLGLGVLALVLIALLIALIAAQGGGGTSTVLQRGAGAGTLRVDVAVVRGLLEQDLSADPRFLAIRVSAHRIRGEAVLKIGARCRRGVEPGEATVAVRDALGALETVLGAAVPAVIELTGGFRVRAAKPARVR